MLPAPWPPPPRPRSSYTNLSQGSRIVNDLRCGSIQGFTCLGESLALGDDRQWPPLYFEKDASHVFAQDAQANELNAAQEQDGDDYGRETRHRGQAHFGKTLSEHT